MLYAILAYHDQALVMSWTSEQVTGLMERLTKARERLNRDGRLGPAARLGYTGTARTLRGPAPGTVIDGPFAETKEQLLGFHLVNYDTDEEAIAAARKLREVNPSAAYEIRPIKLYVPADGFGASTTKG